jgi:four helix bundle protein
MNTEQGRSNDEVNSQNQNKRKFDLEERLIIFAVLNMKVSENLHTTPAGRYISGQIVRSGTSPALHYGEAQSAESRADFVHKLKVLLKELRETFVGLRIIKRVPLTNKMDIVEKRMNREQRINCNF